MSNLKKINYPDLENYISENMIKPFYEERYKKLANLNLKTILKRKNPYLFKAKNITTAEELVKSILEAYLSSQEETMFGNYLENLAIYVCKSVFNGYKAQEGKFSSVDLIFTRDQITYIVGIKSGPFWGNKDQKDRLKNNLKSAKQKIMIGDINVVLVNGCIYGRDKKPLKEDSNDPEKNYFKYCGQEFWELISGDKDLYIKLIKPLDKEAKIKDEKFKELYALKINQMTKIILNEFSINNQIDWEKIVKFVSEKY